MSVYRIISQVLGNTPQEPTPNTPQETPPNVSNTPQETPPNVSNTPQETPPNVSNTPKTDQIMGDISDLKNLMGQFVAQQNTLINTLMTEQAGTQQEQAPPQAPAQQEQAPDPNKAIYNTIRLPESPQDFPGLTQEQFDQILKWEKNTNKYKDFHLIGFYEGEFKAPVFRVFYKGNNKHDRLLKPDGTSPILSKDLRESGTLWALNKHYKIGLAPDNTPQGAQQEQVNTPLQQGQANTPLQQEQVNTPANTPLQGQAPPQTCYRVKGSAHRRNKRGVGRAYMIWLGYSDPSNNSFADGSNGKAIEPIIRQYLIEHLLPVYNGYVDTDTDRSICWIYVGGVPERSNVWVPDSQHDKIIVKDLIKHLNTNHLVNRS